MDKKTLSFIPSMKQSIRTTGTVVTLLILSACSSLDSTLLDGSKVDYRSGSDNLNRNPLEIPPDLTKLSNSNSGQYSVPSLSVTEAATKQKILSEQASTVLPSLNNQYAKLVQDGNERWLVVNAPVEKVWPQIREFWLNQGFALETDNPTIGILETDWLENRAKLPQNWVRKTLGKVLDMASSTGEMDKYRTRIERGANNTTEIFVSHRGMVEVFKKTGQSQGTATNRQQADTIWTPRNPEPELEKEMLALMLQQLGVRTEVAKATVAKPEIRQAIVQAKLIDMDHTKALLVDDSFDRAWRRVGLALDRTGYIVVDRNRAEGIYYVRRVASNFVKEDKPGFFASLAVWRKQDKQKKTAEESDTNLPAQFTVQITAKQDKSMIQIVPKENADTKIDPSAILNQLLSELK